jgi:16S rRNA (guanine527-N7)-methyltransferase
MDRNAFAAQFAVPRGTMAQFDRYAALLTDWQGRMNLIGPSTLPQLWHRHFADSAQLLPVAGQGKNWLDIGAGAGFPGLIIATLDPAATVTLVESIAKKCRFLETVVSELGLGDRVTIENHRIEELPPRRFDVITARALAAIDRLLRWSRPFSGDDTLWLLPKGARWSDEVTEARRSYRFKLDTMPSCTDDAARLLLIRQVMPL